KDGELVTNGGRVLGVIGLGNTLKEAIQDAYQNTEKVSFANAFFRKDIGKKAL
ncbi:MAG: phosphoribosylamine--glycine ligase, partial [Solobacterium sp.]|nr:phosphoribosylamine--glycine ligase [Solobacterium sp.]